MLVLIFEIIGISRSWFLELCICIQHVWYKAWLIHDITDFSISHVWNFCHWKNSFKKSKEFIFVYFICTKIWLKLRGGMDRTQSIWFPLFPANSLQSSVVPRSIMTNMNYYAYHYCQTLNMSKFNHEICLVTKMS